MFSGPHSPQGVQIFFLIAICSKHLQSSSGKVANSNPQVQQTPKFFYNSTVQDFQFHFFQFQLSASRFGALSSRLDLVYRDLSRGWFALLLWWFWGSFGSGILLLDFDSGGGSDFVKFQVLLDLYL